MTWRLVEYECECCGRFEQLERTPVPEGSLCPGCGRTSGLLISAPHVKQWAVSVTRGGVEEPPPGALSTRHLARD